MAMSSHRKKTGSDILKLLAKDDFVPDFVRNVQIASHLREIFLKKQIPAQTKLPSIRTLAELWDTNHSTVYDAMKRLSGEGLVILRPDRGIFVAPPRRALRTVCLYHTGAAHSHKSSTEFYVLLDLELTNILLKRGIAVIPFYDRRVHSKFHTVPPELRIMAGEGKIDAVIATKIFPQHTPWLFELEVPVASSMFRQPERQIRVDISSAVTKVIDLAVKSGRKTIGLIHQPRGVETTDTREDFLPLELQRQARLHGISVVIPEPRTLYQNTHYMHWEQLGSELCEKLLEAATPPDMIFVYPDSFIRGVALALNGRVAVPKEILLISHRNAETDIYVPFPMTWITVKIEDFAIALIEQIDRQIVGEKVTPTTIDLKIEVSSPFRPPL